MLRRILAVGLMLAVAGSVAAQASPAHVQPPIATQDLELDTEAGSVFLQNGTSPLAASARAGSLVVWEKRTPCFEQSSCLEGQSETSRTSMDLASSGLTVSPRDDAEHLTVLKVSEGRTSLTSSRAELDVRPEARDVSLSEDTQAPSDMRTAELPRGMDVPVEGGDLTIEGTFSLQTTGTVVQTDANGSNEEDRRIVTGVTWEQGSDGMEYRILRLARATVDGGLSAAWDGSLLLTPQLPAAFKASEASVEVAEGQLGHANASTGRTVLEDVEATVSGISWQDESEGQLLVREGSQPVAQPEVSEQEGISTTEIVGAGSAAALAVALAAYYWPRISWLGAVALAPLYSRIEKDELFENDTREALYEEIKDDPGIHAHALAEQVDIGWGTTVYHLRRLERNGFVKSEKRGRYRRFFPESGFMEKQREALSTLQNETTNDIAQLVRNRPGLNQSAICEELDISPSLANWHLNRLIDADLVDRERRGRTVHYTPGEAWDALEQLADVEGREVLGDAQAA